MRMEGEREGVENQRTGGPGQRSHGSVLTTGVRLDRCVYRQVVAAVAADERGLVVPVSLVSFSLQTGETQNLKPLQQPSLLLL